MQLSLLLINKFRNKYNINKSTEAELDKLIKDKTTDLVNSDNMLEKQLTDLDRKLGKMI